MYDIAIIGAGPAGATLARLIGREYKVLLIDRRGFHKNQGRSSTNKPCGGLLAPDAQAMIARLGLGLPGEILVGPQLFVVRTIDIQSRIERFYQRFYINMDREKFDRWLVSLVPNTVEMRFGHSLKSIGISADAVTLTIAASKKTYAEQARVLIGADGAKSIVRNLAYQKRKRNPAEYIAIQEHFRQDHPQPFFSLR